VAGSVPFSSAGGHFDPSGANHHGFKNANPAHPHAGDVGNMAGPDNSADLHPVLKLTKSSVAALKTGTAFIIHANADDLTNDPWGNASDPTDRQFCAEIKSK
jgi:Cu/Zn superoxide dismutase